MEVLCHDAKKIYMLFFLLACSLELTASDEAVSSRDEYESGTEKISLLAALESSQPITISRAYSSILGDKQRHEITTPTGTIVLTGDVGVSRQEAKVTMQSSPDEQYVFVESGHSAIRVFAKSPGSNTFMYRSTLPVSKQGSTSHKDDGTH